ncbi:LysR substrate-binding domain-containing protein, partial [Pseudomonadota bacterium]
TAADLRGHNCLIDTAPRHGARWPIDGKSTHTWRADGNFVVNSGELVRDLAIASAGVALLPTFFVKEQIDCGDLVSLLQDCISSFDAGVYLVYPQAKHVSGVIRTFIDYVVAYCGNHNQFPKE